MSLFILFKWLHILSAIVAIGVNLTYSVWIVRATRSPETLPFTLKTVKLLDDRIANPAYVALLLTGLGMVSTLPEAFHLTTPWILSGLVLYVIASALGIAGYTPNLRKQIALAESEGPGSEAYQAVAKRGATMGIALGVITMVIVFLMVVKPALWG